jgi:hypothetical protein
VGLGDADGNHAALMRPAPDGLLRTRPVDQWLARRGTNSPELRVELVAGSGQDA